MDLCVNQASHPIRSIKQFMRQLLKLMVNMREQTKKKNVFITNNNFSLCYIAYPSPLNYRGFPKSVCISVNEVICHGIPDNRPLVEGDIVNCDVTAFKDVRALVSVLCLLFMMCLYNICVCMWCLCCILYCVFLSVGLSWRLQRYVLRRQM